MGADSLVLHPHLLIPAMGWDALSVSDVRQSIVALVRTAGCFTRRGIRHDFTADVNTDSYLGDADRRADSGCFCDDAGEGCRT